MMAQPITAVRAECGVLWRLSERRTFLTIGERNKLDQEYRDLGSVQESIGDISGFDNSWTVVGFQVC